MQFLGFFLANNAGPVQQADQGLRFPLRESLDTLVYFDD